MTSNRLCNHHEVVRILSDLRGSRLPGAPRSIPRTSTGRRRAPRKQSQGGLPVGATPPPPPSGSGSAPQPSQLSQSTSYIYDEPSATQVTFTPNLPSWLEALKGHDLVTQTTTSGKISSSNLPPKGKMFRLRLVYPDWHQISLNLPQFTPFTPGKLGVMGKIREN